MEIIKTEIEGVVILEPRIFRDARGYFFESFSVREFEEKVARTTFVQDNESCSSYGVIRGLHFQKPPFTQAKLVRVILNKNCSSDFLLKFTNRKTFKEIPSRISEYTRFVNLRRKSLEQFLFKIMRVVLVMVL